ncbi:aspartic peptidase domain-containing protein [Mycena galericulata]|nr:aspartic peptidase domain-containing protein [Mycena galericulata]
MLFCKLLIVLGGAVARSSASITHGTRFPLHLRGQQMGATLQSIANIPFTNASGTLTPIYPRYASNVTVNGQNFMVAVDTGSSDFWLVPPQNFAFNNSEFMSTFSYGGGYIGGMIGFASVQFGGYTFEHQAFLNATMLEFGGVVDSGLSGLIGLSFDGVTPSNIMRTLESYGKESQGEPFLFNIFDQTPEQDNFIGISLSRTGDLQGTADGSFTINEVDEAYPGVVSTSLIPLFPGNDGRWTILVDSISVDGVNVSMPKSSVTSAPAGKLVALMDTGTPTLALPQQLMDAIYSKVPGSNYGTSTAFGGTMQMWTIPCNTTTIVSVQIGHVGRCVQIFLADIRFSGEAFPIHPLDLSEDFPDFIHNTTTCPASLSETSRLTLPSFNFGNSDFGNSVAHSPTGNASIQLLSLTDPVAAAADVLNVRKQEANTPLSIAAAAVQDPSTPNAPSHSNGASPFAAALGASTSDSDDSEVTKYAPIVIGLLGGNLLVALILFAMGVVLCVKRGKSMSSGKYAKVRFHEDAGETRPLDGFDSDRRYSD